MPRLTEIIYKMFFSKGYFTKDGNRVSWRTDDCVVAYDSEYVRDVKMLPREVEQYLIQKNLRGFITEAFNFVNQFNLVRLLDGRGAVFPYQRIVIKAKEESRERFQSKGFVPYADTMYGFQMEPEEYQQLADFLREAGLKFEFDQPPWMEDSFRRLLKIKPSSKRLGEEFEHYFGFG